MARQKKPVTGKAGTGPPRKSVPQSAYARLLVAAPAGTLIFRWAKFDFGGPWCLSHPAGDVVDMMRRLKSFETMRPIETFGTTKTYLGTDYDVPRIPNSAALARLSEIGFGDETQISALRIGGQPRLWGFRRDPEFYPVFWDPLHEICPSPKKHT